MQILAQAIGIIAMIFNIGSFQCKKSKHLIAAIGMGSLLFSVNYMLIGAFASAGFNIINILRSVFVINRKTHNNVFFVIVCALCIAVAVSTYENVWTLVLLVAQLVATFAMWYKDGGFIRKAQFFCVSPIWLTNNIFVSFTIGGIICELFTIVSVLVSFIRFGKEELAKQ